RLLHQSDLRIDVMKAALANIPRIEVAHDHERLDGSLCPRVQGFGFIHATGRSICIIEMNRTDECLRTGALGVQLSIADIATLRISAQIDRAEFARQTGDDTDIADLHITVSAATRGLKEIRYARDISTTVDFLH